MSASPAASRTGKTGVSGISGSSNNRGTSQKDLISQEITPTQDQELLELTNIIDQETALTGNAPYITIGGKEILIFAPVGSASWALFNLILSTAGVILASLISIRVFLIKKREDKKECNINDPFRFESNENRYGLTNLTAVLIISIAGVLLYLLTQDRRNIIALTDVWTPVHMIFLTAESVSFILVCLRLKKSFKSNKLSATMHSLPVND